MDMYGTTTEQEGPEMACQKTQLLTFMHHFYNNLHLIYSAECSANMYPV